MEPTISWLHLSDRHTNGPRTGWDADKVIKSLVEDLRRVQKEQGIRPDFLFFTGDLAWGQVSDKPGENLKDQFAEGHRFLEAVRNALDPVIPLQNVFVVPGNHDLNRGAVLKQSTHWLNVAATSDEVNEMIRKGSAEWAQYVARLKLYGEFLESHGYSHLLSDPDRLIYAEVREAGGRKLGIAGFNSAWSCGSGKPKEKGTLWAGGRWQVETLSSAFDDADVKLALVHHPGSWFVDGEQHPFWRYGLEERFHVRLHGHEHDAWINMLDGKVSVSAAACYDRSDKANGYNFVRLFPRLGRGEVWLGCISTACSHSTTKPPVPQQPPWVLRCFSCQSLPG